MGQPTTKQVLQLQAVLFNNLVIDNLDDVVVQQIINDPKGSGEQFEWFLRNKGRVMIGEARFLIVDRTNPFNPTEFIGQGVTIWRGPKEGNGLEGEGEQDSRSLAISEFSIVNLRFEHMLKDKEKSITGEEKLKRHIKAGHIRLDAKVAQTLYEEPGQVTLEWLYKNFKVTWMEFPGTTLRNSGGHRFFLYLYRLGDGRWRWDYGWLVFDRSADYPSAVLAK